MRIAAARRYGSPSGGTLAQPKRSLVETYVALAANEGEDAVERIASLTGAAYGTARAAATEALQVFRTLDATERERLRVPRRTAPPLLSRRRRIGTIGGFPIFVHVSTALWLLVFVAARSGATRPAPVAIVAGLLVSVLLHELAHATTCRRLGLGVGTVTIWALGGFFVPLALEKPAFLLEPGQRRRYAAVAIAGPAATLALAAIAALVAQVTRSPVAAELARLNGWLALINLAPLPPLDGGFALLCLASLRVRWRIAYRVLGGGCLLLGAAALLHATARQAVGSTAWFLVFGGLSALRVSFRSETELVRQQREGVEAERRLAGAAPP